MKTLSESAATLDAKSGSTFGFVTPPEGAYNRFQTDLTNWSSGANTEFNSIATQINKNAQGYKDLASEQIEDIEEITK